MNEQEPRLDAPDHTKIQLVAVVQAVVAVAVAFGVPITNEQSVALLALAGVLGSVLIGADAAIRRERARNADKLRPHTSVTATQTPAGTEYKTEMRLPLDGLEGDPSALDEAVRAALARVLLASGGAGPGRNSHEEAPRRAPAR